MAKDPRYLALPAAVLVHCAEELPRFPSYVKRRFGGTTTTRFYLASHAALLLPGVLTAGLLPWRSPQGQTGNWMAAASAAGFIGNAVFHLTASLRWREYSPGVVSALTIVTPSALGTLRIARNTGLRGRPLHTAVATGTLLNLLAVGTLYLNMPPLGGPTPIP